MKISHDSWLNRVLHCGGWLCFVLLVLITCIRGFYLFPGTSDILTDADIIQLPTMFLDLKANLDNFWGWQLPDAPYYFPDTLGFLLTNWLIQNSWWSIAVYSLVQASFLVFGCCWIYKEMGGKNTGILLVLLLGVFLLFTNIYVSVFDNVQGFIAPYIYFLATYIHFGTYLSSLFALAASLNYLRTGKIFSLLIVLVLAILTTASDLLFAICFTIPFIATITFASKAYIFFVKHRVKRFCQLIFSASLIAYIYNKYIDPLAATTTVEIKFDKIFISFKTIVIDLWKAEFSEQAFLLFSIIIPLIYLTVFTLILSKKNIINAATRSSKNQNKHTFKLIVCPYIIMAVISNILAVIVLGKYTTIPHARYLIFVYYSPGLIAIVLASLWLEKIKQTKNITIAAIVAISIISSASLLTQKSTSISDILSPPAYANCFNLNQPQAGLAEYWQSKPLIAFSQRNIQIATIRTEGKPSTWNSNRYWYTNSWIEPGSLPQFRFIFMKSLDKKAIAQRYGKPDRIEACTDSEIWWYDNPEGLYPQLMRDGF
ncbi:MAG: hypothetical protein ACFCAD_16515 [Pleurocapsa sp.]